MEMTLTALDTAGIQSYIFNSNELRENVGASHLVHLATTHWVERALDVVKVKHNYQDCKYDETFYIEQQGNPCAEVLYAGGGNTYILFAGDNHAKTARDFVYTLSKWVIEKAPGLNLYAAHEGYNWGQQNLSATIKQVVEALSRLKNQMTVYQPLLGLSVTADCASTGLPANGTHPDPDKNGENNGRATLANRANRQVMAQWHAARHEDEKEYGDDKKEAGDISATKRLRRLFGFVKDAGFKWTDDLDKIGKLPDRDESYIAVVHADGNGMGKRMQNLSDFFRNKIYDSYPRAYITAVRSLSTSYQETALKAFKRTICDLVHSLKFHEKGEGDKKRYYSRAPKKKGTNEWEDYFPFRPVVFGGDDVTWVCAAPWGLPLAQRYLEYLESYELPDGKTLLKDLPATVEKAKAIEVLAEKLGLPAPPFACAGVSIVKTHYPISRAYDNSEALCKSAKRQVLLYEPDKKASALDWHITATGLAGKLKEIRQREYETAESDPAGETYYLTMRPLMLKKEYTWRNWENFHSIYEQFDKHEWFKARNKVMTLRETLRQGPTAVSEFERTERLGNKLPYVMQRESSGETLKTKMVHGWMNWEKSDKERIDRLPLKPTDNIRSKEQELAEVRCAYFDVIEMEGQILRLERCQEMEEEIV